MRLLGRFAIVLLLLGLGLGWYARRRWGPLRSVAPLALVAAAAPFHAAIVAMRGVGIGVGAAPLLTYGLATAALFAVAVAVAAWTLRTRPRWSAPVPLAQALLQTLATSALSPAYTAAGAAPPGLGSAAVVAIAIVALGAVFVWATPRATPRSGPGRGLWGPWRSGRLRS
jgi:Kef-type K+ transport system membrane component KefB